MSLKNISLDPYLLAELYSFPIIVPEESDTKFQEKSKNKAPASLSYAGSNKKKVLILIHQPDKEALSKSALLFLTNILMACHLKIDDVAIVNHAFNEEIHFQELTQQLQTQKALLFGEETKNRIAIEVDHNQIRTIDNIPTLYFQTALDHLKDDRAMKKALWSSLRKLFNL